MRKLRLIDLCNLPEVVKLVIDISQNLITSNLPVLAISKRCYFLTAISFFFRQHRIVGKRKCCDQSYVFGLCPLSFPVVLLYPLITSSKLYSRHRQRCARFVSHMKCRLCDKLTISIWDLDSQSDNTCEGTVDASSQRMLYFALAYRWKVGSAMAMIVAYCQEYATFVFPFPPIQI